MNLPVAGVMHQLEIREVIRPAVTVGPHVVDVDLFTIVQSLITPPCGHRLPWDAAFLLPHNRLSAIA